MWSSIPLLQAVSTGAVWVGFVAALIGAFAGLLAAITGIRAGDLEKAALAHRVAELQGQNIALAAATKAQAADIKFAKAAAIMGLG